MFDQQSGIDGHGQWTDQSRPPAPTVRHTFDGKGLFCSCGEPRDSGEHLRPPAPPVEEVCVLCDPSSPHLYSDTRCSGNTACSFHHLREQPQPTAAYITGLEPPLMTNLERQLTAELETAVSAIVQTATLLDTALQQRDQYLNELQQTRAVVEVAQEFLASHACPAEALCGMCGSMYDALIALDTQASAGSSRPAPESEP